MSCGVMPDCRCGRRSHWAANKRRPYMQGICKFPIAPKFPGNDTHDPARGERKERCAHTRNMEHLSWAVVSSVFVRARTRDVWQPSQFFIAGCLGVHVTPTQENPRCLGRGWK